MRQRADNLMSDQTNYVRISDRHCPLCDGYLIRAPRRPVDRLWSLFKPVSRYRCYRFSCQWRGNLPRRTTAGETAAGERGERVPVAFITYMTLTLGGAILVLVVGFSEPLPMQEAMAWTLGQTQSTAIPVAEIQTSAAPTVPTVAVPTVSRKTGKAGVTSNAAEN